MVFLEAALAADLVSARKVSFLMFMFCHTCAHVLTEIGGSAMSLQDMRALEKTLIKRTNALIRMVGDGTAAGTGPLPSDSVRHF